MEKSIRWVGLDVHADSIAIAELDEDTKEVRTSEVDPSPKAIAKRFKRMAVGVDLRVCYEAGGCGFELYRQLASLGIECVVIAPSLVPKKPGDHVKTDRRDAIRLARARRRSQRSDHRTPPSLELLAAPGPSIFRCNAVDRQAQGVACGASLHGGDGAEGVRALSRRR